MARVVGVLVRETLLALHTSDGFLAPHTAAACPLNHACLCAHWVPGCLGSSQAATAIQREVLPTQAEVTEQKEVCLARLDASFLLFL